MPRPMAPNAMDDTFSTIARTLAGAFGLPPAVALDRIRAIEAVMAETVREVRRVDIRLKDLM